MVMKKSAKAKPKTSTRPKNSSPKAIAVNDEKDWRAQDDARTLKQSMEIKNDPARMKAAQEHVMREMEAMKIIAKMKGSK